MEKKLEKSLITIDGVSRSPLAFTPINYTLNNNGGSISVGATYFGISGISSILPGDVLKVDDEFVKVNAVGLGTTTIGPITGTGSLMLLRLREDLLELWQPRILTDLPSDCSKVLII